MRRISVLILVVLLFLSVPIKRVGAADISGGIFLAHFDGNTQNARDGNSGTSSGVTYSSAKFNNGATFDGTDYLYYEASGNINRSAGTVEFWYKPSYDWSSSGQSTILFLYDVNSQSLSYVNYFGIWGQIATGNKTQLVAELGVSTAGVTQVLRSSSSTSWTASSLHHIAVTWDSSDFKLYVDGSLEDSISSPTLLDVDRTTIFIGNDMFAESYSAKGTLDELLIVNSARSASEISSDYSATSAFSITSTGVATVSGPPTISSIAASVSERTATITWTTNENSYSIVDYGLTTSYGNSVGQATDTVTSHTVTITGLTPETTYHYRVRSKDTDGNESISSDYTFTTWELDKTPPVITISTQTTVFSEKNIIIKGNATDNRSGVVAILYTLDGTNFIPIMGTGAFTIKLELEDGNYRLQVKAVDAEGNEGLSSPVRFVVDTIPPRVGACLYSLGPQILFPNEQGLIFTREELEKQITLSLAGGTTTAHIQPKSVNGEGDLKATSLTKKLDTGLWSAKFKFSESGIYNLEIYAVDGAENELHSTLNTMVVSENGVVSDGKEPIEGAEVTVYFFDPVQGKFVLWDGKSFNQENPQKGDEEGKYGVTVSTGKYYLEISAPGYKKLRTRIFELEKSTVINSDFILKKSFSFRLGRFTLYFPSFGYSFANVRLKSPLIPKDIGADVNLIGKEIPSFSIGKAEDKLTNYDLRGKSSVVTFLTNWSPFIGEQLEALDELAGSDKYHVVGILVHESDSAASIYEKRGRYKVSLFADKDGNLIEFLKIHSTPTHVFLDRRGIIKDVKVGILSKEEILDSL